jgi:hypothetical protein
MSGGCGMAVACNASPIWMPAFVCKTRSFCVPQERRSSLPQHLEVLRGVPALGVGVNEDVTLMHNCCMRTICTGFVCMQNPVIGCASHPAYPSISKSCVVRVPSALALTRAKH